MRLSPDGGTENVFVTNNLNVCLAFAKFAVFCWLELSSLCAGG